MGGTGSESGLGIGMEKGKGAAIRKGKGVEAIPAMSSKTVAGWIPPPLAPSNEVSGLDTIAKGALRPKRLGTDAAASTAGEVGSEAATESQAIVAPILAHTPGPVVKDRSSASEADHESMGFVAPSKRQNRPAEVSIELHQDPADGGEDQVEAGRGETAAEIDYGFGHSSQGMEEGHDEDDVDVAVEMGIDGLTIVLHLRGKEDLVISADLTSPGGQT